MARIVNEEEYAFRRNEILDTARQLVYAKGYEQMTIQDILQERQISKGAFYYYFDSKGALLEALIERMMDEALLILQPIVEDPNLPALDKFQQYFSTAGRWKTAQKDFLLQILRVWYADDNAIVRQKVSTAGLERIAPMIDTIVEQGVQEGVFAVSCPDRLGEVSLFLMYGLGDKIVQQLLSEDPGKASFEEIKDTLAAFTRALERVLGAPHGSIMLVEPEIMEEWYEVAKEVQI
jgi:AcrR family transcriptional regulator